jgi:hypothetical protein
LGATIAIETPDGKRAEPSGMGLQFAIVGGEKTSGRQRFEGLRELLPFPDDRSAYQVLFEYTKGLPRDVIKVADDVLRHLMAHNKKQITIAEIEAIIQENNLTKAPADS